MADADGRRHVQFTRGESSASGPAFSPDGRWLAFTTSRSGSNQIWVLPLDGGEAHQVTEAKPGVGQYRWSPDGKRVSPSSCANPQTEEEEKAAKEKRDVILVDQNFKYGHIYTVPFDPAATRDRRGHPRHRGRLPRHQLRLVPRRAAVRIRPPGGSRASTPGGSRGISRWWTRTGGEVTQLVTGAGIESSPRWSPDGSLIAYASTGGQPEPIGLADLYVVDPATGEFPHAPRDPEPQRVHSRLVGQLRTRSS